MTQMPTMNWKEQLYQLGREFKEFLFSGPVLVGLGVAFLAGVMARDRELLEERARQKARIRADIEDIIPAIRNGPQAAFTEILDKIVTTTHRSFPDRPVDFDLTIIADKLNVGFPSDTSINTVKDALIKHLVSIYTSGNKESIQNTLGQLNSLLPSRMSRITMVWLPAAQGRVLIPISVAARAVLEIDPQYVETAFFPEEGATRRVVFSNDRVYGYIKDLDSILYYAYIS